MVDAAGVEVDEGHDIVIASVRGEIDLANARAAERAVLASLHGAPRGLCLDVSDATYLDSAAIRMLFSVAEAATERGWRAALVCLPGSTMAKALDVVEIGQALDRFENLDDARAALRA